MLRIVRLPGITLDDLRAAEIAQVAPVRSEKSLYVALPSQFVRIEDWPERTNLHCRNCDQVPLGTPYMVATGKFQSAGGQTVYAVEGPFDQWCCAAAYIDTYYPQHAMEMKHWLSEIEYMFTGERKLKIPSAYSKFLHRRFIGDERGLTTDQWNELNAKKSAQETVRPALQL